MELCFWELVSNKRKPYRQACFDASWVRNLRKGRWVGPGAGADGMISSVVTSRLRLCSRGQGQIPVRTPHTGFPVQGPIQATYLHGFPWQRGLLYSAIPNLSDFSLDCKIEAYKIKAFSENCQMIQHIYEMIWENILVYCFFLVTSCTFVLNQLFLYRDLTVKVQSYQQLLCHTPGFVLGNSAVRISAHFCRFHVWVAGGLASF